MACYIQSWSNRNRVHRASQAARGGAWCWSLCWPAAPFAFLLLLLLPLGSFADSREQQLEFNGQVKIPEHTLRRRARILLVLSGVTSSYSGREWADFDGRFRFHKIKPGSYSLVIYFPGVGQVIQSLDITRSFSDAKGRIQKQFEFDEKDLRVVMQNAQENTVTVRELSIPWGAKVEYEKALVRLEHSDGAGAIQHFEKALEKAPQFAEALNHIGTIYFQQREFSKAEHYFREALEKDPHAYEPLVNLGGALLSLDRPREALAINQHAQNTRPGDPLANAQLGLSYMALGDYERAIECLQTTEKLDPAHFTYPQIPLAEIYLHLANRPSAERQLEEFLKVHPDSEQSEKVRRALDRLRKESEPPS
jgi:tetratricopeptide (TPR) repeat protein